MLLVSLIVGFALQSIKELESSSWSICQTSMVLVTAILVLSRVRKSKLKLPLNYTCFAWWILMWLQKLFNTSWPNVCFSSNYAWYTQPLYPINLKIAGSESLKLKYLDLYRADWWKIWIFLHQTLSHLHRVGQRKRCLLRLFPLFWVV